MRTSPVPSSVKDSLSSYFVYRAPLLRRERQWKKKFLLENPPPFLSQYFVLNFTCYNLGSVKPTTDGRCCTHKSYLLDVVTRSNPLSGAWRKLRPHPTPPSCRHVPDIGPCLALCILLWIRNPECKTKRSLVVSATTWVALKIERVHVHVDVSSPQPKCLVALLCLSLWCPSSRSFALGL